MGLFFEFRTPHSLSVWQLQHPYAAPCRYPVAHLKHCSRPIPAGVAMGAAGADVAIDSADVVLFTTDLRRLGSVMRIAKSARRKIGENIAIAVAAKVRIPAVMSSLEGACPELALS